MAKSLTLTKNMSNAAMQIPHNLPAAAGCGVGANPACIPSSLRAAISEPATGRARAGIRAMTSATTGANHAKTAGLARIQQATPRVRRPRRSTLLATTHANCDLPKESTFHGWFLVVVLCAGDFRRRHHPTTISSFGVGRFVYVQIGNKTSLWPRDDSSLWSALAGLVGADQARVILVAETDSAGRAHPRS